jgi:hypothetical protein
LISSFISLKWIFFDSLFFSWFLGVQIWLGGKAESPFLYDRSWGGLVMCGCDYHWDEEIKEGHCLNQVPNCPALTDAGQNFGAGKNCV